jgi:hypothetical protein
LSDTPTTQAISLFIAAVPLLEKLVWPVFLWLILRRKDVHEHIRTMLNNNKLARIKVLGNELVFVVEKGNVKQLPDEMERVSNSTPIKPRLRT